MNGEIEPEAFAVPAALAPFLRSPEEIAADEARLTELFGAMLGDWYSEEDAEVTMGFDVGDGFLRFVRPERDPAFLLETDDPLRVVMLGADYVSFTGEMADDGSLVAVVIRVGDEVRDRLVRAPL